MKFIRLTKNSSENLRSCEKIFFERLTNFSGIQWVVVFVQKGSWSFPLSNSVGPIHFSNVDDAVSFLRRRKVCLDKIDYNSANKLLPISESGSRRCPDCNSGFGPSGYVCATCDGTGKI